MSSLTFSLHRVSANQIVDWDAVDDELDKIPAELKDPRFDSLRHVLNILSAVDAEAALDEVRAHPGASLAQTLPEACRTCCSCEVRGRPSRD